MKQLSAAQTSGLPRVTVPEKIQVQTQLSLLNQPRHRATDPHTSVAAATSISAAAPILESAISATITARQPCTADEVARRLETLFPGRWTHGTVVTAVTRCVKRGLIVPDGTALTSRGSRATAYRSAP